MNGKLTALGVAKAGVGMHGDGDGLWLFVTKRKDGSLSKRFVFRYRQHGKYGEVPIGPFPAVGLAEARDRANSLRGDLARGVDPATTRREAMAAKKVEAIAAKVAALPPYTFKVAMNEYIEAMGKTKWRSAQAARQYAANLRRYALPVIGDKPVADISHEDALAILDPLYKHSAIVAARVRIACEAIFGYAKTRHRFAAANPFSWKGNLEHLYPARPDAGHFKAIPYRQLPALVAQLTEMGDRPDALAARFQIALALRPREARLLRFDWIDEKAGTITIPLTKNGSPFTIPINEAAAAVIERCRDLRSSEWVFPGRNGRQPLAEGTIYVLVNSLTGASAHAVARSCFSDWAYETHANVADSVIEASLNHAVGDRTVRAYKRGDQLELRRRLMAAWSDFILGCVVDTGTVIPFAKVAGGQSGGA
jgi:integrase